MRELAQRSAHAAKEIKDLILNSVDEVSSGVKLVRDTGQTLRINRGTDRPDLLINTQLDAVTVASNVQSASFRSQPDHQSTGSSYAAECCHAEECTAASTALAAEAKRLRSIVTGFKIDTGNAMSEQRTDQAGAETASMTSPARLILGKVAQAIGTLRPSG